MADWMDFLYINYYGCDVYGYSGSHASYCTKPKAQKVLASVYVTTLIITLGNIMMSLFIGVITNRMEEATLKLKETKEEKVEEEECADQQQPRQGGSTAVVKAGRSIEL